MKRILAVIASVRFFVLVALALGIVALAASFVPQGLPAVEHEQRMGPVLWPIVRALGLHSVRTSPLILALVALMETSLLACTLPRLVRRLRHHRSLAVATFAPDIIHLGLAIVVAGGFAQLAFGQEWRYDGPIDGTLAVGDEVIRVTAAGELYTDRDVLSGWYVEVRAGGDRVRFGSNDPATTAVGRLHFRNYTERGTVTLSAGDRELELAVGEGLAGEGGGAVILLAADEEAAVFADVSELPADEARIAGAIREAARVTVSAGETLGSLVVAELRSQTRVAFTVSRNPGRVPVLVGLVLLAIGMLLYGIARVRGRT